MTTTTDRIRWTKGIRLEKGGHRIFREDRGEFAAPETCRWAIADNSGPTPDRTEDGILWLDFECPLGVDLREHGDIVDIPIRRVDRTGYYHTMGGVDALAKLRELFPSWPVKLGAKAAKLVAALGPSKVWFAEFPGLWLGGYATIVADTEQAARDALAAEPSFATLDKGKPPKDVKIREIDASKPGVADLYNGDY